MFQERVTVEGPQWSRRGVAPPFARVLCAVDGSLGGHAAIQRSIDLARHDVELTLMAVADRADETRARDALSVADALARDAGIEADCRLVHAPEVAKPLLLAAQQHDLLVLGAHRRSRTAGIVMGDTASIVAHRARKPILLARPRPLTAGIVAATDLSPHTRPALTAAAHIAARLGLGLTLLHVEARDGVLRPGELSAELANLRAALGAPPRLRLERCAPAAGILAVAGEECPGLIALGCAMKTGLAALGSVSERVAQHAECSVLIWRDGP